MTKLHLRKLAAVATTAGLAFYANAAIARDVWLTLNGDSASRRVGINYGHPDDRPPPFADEVLDLVAIKSDGKKSLLKTSED
jgi:nickel transport protein